MRKPYVLISDAKGGYRASLIASNGKMLMQSEVIQRPVDVLRNIAASARVFMNWHVPKTNDQMWLAIGDATKVRYSGKRKEMTEFLKTRPQ